MYPFRGPAALLRPWERLLLRSVIITLGLCVSDTEMELGAWAYPAGAEPLPVFHWTVLEMSDFLKKCDLSLEHHLSQIQCESPLHLPVSRPG